MLPASRRRLHLPSFPRRRESSDFPATAMKQPAVYILASGRNGPLYIGVTSALLQRVWQHREHCVAGFAARREVELLVWFEPHETMESAILREKRLKKWNREWNLRLVEERNPYWNDLWSEIAGTDQEVTGFPPSRE